MTTPSKTCKHRSGNRRFRFLPVSPRDRDWGLYVTAAGYESISPNSPYPLPHRPSVDWAWQRGRVLQVYAVVYITEGHGEFESEATRPIKIEPGSAILLFPGVRHRYRPSQDTGWDDYWVLFQGDYADRLRERRFLRPEEPVIKIGIDERVQRAFTALLDRIESESFGSQQLNAVNTLEIIASLGNCCATSQGSHPGSGPSGKDGY